MSASPWHQGPASTVLLDDDPTGPQLSANTTVVLRWTDLGRVVAAARNTSALFMLTNSRALEPAGAHAVVREAAMVAREVLPDCRVVLRADSTLRGHLLVEYQAVASTCFPGRRPALLLVPAMPAAGRLTIGGVHYLRRGGGLVPLSETEYASDTEFGYRTSHLLDYVEQRSGGLFAASRGLTIDLASLREGGPVVVSDALHGVAETCPAAVVVDAATDSDLELIREGIARSEGEGDAVVTRCSPSLAALFAGGIASRLPTMPEMDGPVLVVCGSYVPNSRHQLDALRTQREVGYVELNVGEALASGPAAAAGPIAARVSHEFEKHRVVVLATPVRRQPERITLVAGEQVAQCLAAAAVRVHPAPSVIVAKGGITSAVLARDGFGADVAHVVGPVADGISRWNIPGCPPLLVFPGNVGGPDALVRLLDSEAAA